MRSFDDVYVRRDRSVAYERTAGRPPHLRVHSCPSSSRTARAASKPNASGGAIVSTTYWLAT